MMQDKDNRCDYAETIITKSQNTTLLFVAEVYDAVLVEPYRINAVGKNERSRDTRKEKNKTYKQNI